jgi:hypothetical protein
MGNATLPGQNGNASVYLSEAQPHAHSANVQLKIITTKLQALGTKLLFALTSPMLCNANEDWVVRHLNEQADAYMQSVGIPTINLHDAVRPWPSAYSHIMRPDCLNP